MKRIGFLFLLTVMFTVFSCTKQEKLDGVKQIVITDNADVTVKQGDEVKIESGYKDDNQVNYVFANNVLTIGGNSDAVLYLPNLDNIQSITVDSNGDLEADDLVLHFQDLAITVMDNGDLSIKLTGNNLAVNVAGDGDLEIKGDSCNAVVLNASDEADYSAKGFIVKDYTVNLSGYADAEVYATNSITGAISDYSDLYYEGLDASNVNVQVSDSANIHNGFDHK